MYIAFAASIPWRVYPLLHCSLRFISCSMVCCNWTISSCPQMSVHWWLFLTFHYNSLLSIFVLRIHKNIRNFNVLKMSLILFRPNHEYKIFKLIQFNIKCLLPHTNLMGYFSTWHSDSILVLKSIFGGYKSFAGANNTLPWEFWWSILGFKTRADPLLVCFLYCGTNILTVWVLAYS